MKQSRTVGNVYLKSYYLQGKNAIINRTYLSGDKLKFQYSSFKRDYI